MEVNDAISGPFGVSGFLSSSMEVSFHFQRPLAFLFEARYFFTASFTEWMWFSSSRTLLPTPTESSSFRSLSSTSFKRSSVVDVLETIF